MSTIAILQKKYKHVPVTDFILLLAHTIQKPKEFIFAHSEHRLSVYQKIWLYYYLKKYQQGIPIAYITGYKEFFGLNFFVNKHTLIPRADTEIMVEEVLRNIKNETLLIDVGTGTGCVPIAIAKTIQQSNQRIVNIFAIDISSQALKLATRNAAYHKIPITFLHGNLLEPLTAHLYPTSYELKAKSYIITANLPYLTHEQFEQEPSIQHEPYSALVGGVQGLALYEKLLQQIKNLQITNYHLQAFFEIDPSQTEKIKEMIKKYFSLSIIEIQKDLAGRDRLVILHLNL